MTFNRDCFNATLLIIDKLSKPEFVGNEWQFCDIGWKTIVNAVKSQGYEPAEIVSSLFKLKNAEFITTDDAKKNNNTLNFKIYEVSYAGCLYMEENNLK